MKKILFGLLIAVSMYSCSVRSSEVKAKKFEDKVTYFQCQKTGEVFAVIGIKRGIDFIQNGVGLAHIDRKDVTPAIKKQIKNYREF